MAVGSGDGSGVGSSVGAMVVAYGEGASVGSKVGTSTHDNESSKLPSSAAVAPSTEIQYDPTSRNWYVKYEHANEEL